MIKKIMKLTNIYSYYNILFSDSCGTVKEGFINKRKIAQMNF